MAFNLLNTHFRRERERVRRVDCLVYEGNHSRSLYEMKTYFKPHERMTTALFDKDIKKMAEFLAGHDSASVYFLIAGSAAESKTASWSKCLDCLGNQDLSL